VTGWPDPADVGKERAGQRDSTAHFCFHPPYCGLAVVTRSSADHKIVEGQIVKSQKKVSTRGLNRNHSPRLKQVFKIKAASGGKVKKAAVAFEERGRTFQSPAFSVATDRA
jgi:hypothetical protein